MPLAGCSPTGCCLLLLPSALGSLVPRALRLTRASQLPCADAVRARNHARQSLIQDLDSVSAPGHWVGPQPVARDCASCCPESCFMGTPPPCGLPYVCCYATPPRFPLWRQVPGRKALVLDPKLSGPLALVVQTSLLKVLHHLGANQQSTDRELLHNTPTRPGPLEDPGRVSGSSSLHGLLG